MRPSIRLTAVLLTSGISFVSNAQSVATPDDFDRLKAQVAAQQQQIDELRRLVEKQQELILSAFQQKAAPAFQLVAERAAPATPPRTPPTPATQAVLPSQASAAAKPPLSLDIGSVAFTPTGWLDFTQVWRSRSVSSGLPTNFASIPFNDTVPGRRRQTLSSAANTRMGVRMDTKVLGARVLGVVETDFLGFTPSNVATTTNSDGLRLRLAFVDLQKDKWEVLGGQAWSLLTPSRKGMSPLPGTLFLTQDLDPNIMTGLTWARSPQLRVVYHANDTVSMGVSFESGNTYAGGSSGSGVSTLPSALAPNYFGQVDTGSGGLSVPNPNTDMIAKVAFDPKVGDRATHIEIAGLLTRAAFFNPLTERSFSKLGGGVSLNAGIEVIRRLTLFTNNFYSNGGGRFVFGQGPGLIIRGDGSPSFVRAMSTVNGFEYQVAPKWMLFSYYGGSYFGRNVTLDPANGSPVGYGYPGSPNSHNRSIQEIASGFQHVFWRNPQFGALQFAGQYSWLVRHPWHVAPGKPGSANLNMIYLNLRYVLPGQAPVLK